MLGHGFWERTFSGLKLFVDIDLCRVDWVLAFGGGVSGGKISPRVVGTLGTTQASMPCPFGRCVCTFVVCLAAWLLSQFVGFAGWRLLHHLVSRTFAGACRRHHPGRRGGVWHCVWTTHFSVGLFTASWSPLIFLGPWPRPGWRGSRPSKKITAPRYIIQLP